jgi:hypothetical protein
MPKKPSLPAHRRIYVVTRIKKIAAETKELKQKLGEKPSKTPSAYPGEASHKAHQEQVYDRERFKELRKEMTALRAEHKALPRRKAKKVESDFIE